MRLISAVRNTGKTEAVYILDTNVVSELMKGEIDTKVMRWFRSVPFSQVYITTVTAGELWYGVKKLPLGKKRNTIEFLVRSVIEKEFVGRILNFTESASEPYGAIFAAQEKAGSEPNTADAQIAAIASEKKFAVATRNVKDFRNAGIDIINPWAD